MSAARCCRWPAQSFERGSNQSCSPAVRWGFFIGADMLVYMSLRCCNLSLSIPPCVSLLAVGVATSPGGPHWPGRPPFFGAGRLARGGLRRWGWSLRRIARCSSMLRLLLRAPVSPPMGVRAIKESSAVSSNTASGLAAQSSLNWSGVSHSLAVRVCSRLRGPH